MRRIGILTFHRANNYGAVLQAYALSTYLNSLNNISAEIIDYRSDVIEARNPQLPFSKHSSKKLKKIIRNALSLNSILTIRDHFEHFRTERLALSKSVFKAELGDIAKDYDILICGSDQIWNNNITGNDTSFFLDFANQTQRVFSYAASIGDANLIKGNEQFFVDQLKHFHDISVREESTKNCLQKLIDRDVRTDIDPVFLLSAKEWASIEKPINRKPYILVFKMGLHKSGEYILKFAKKLGNEKGLDVVFLSDNELWYKYRQFKHFGSASVEEFLGLIHGAESVVTNSFHATAFSIIFNKEFYVETDIPRAERVCDLISVANLGQACLKKGIKHTNSHPILWDDVNFRLEVSITQSKKYLTDIFK